MVKILQAMASSDSAYGYNINIVTLVIKKKLGECWAQSHPVGTS